VTVSLNDAEVFKAKVLQWASEFEVCCYLDSNNFTDRYSKFDCLIACGVKQAVVAGVDNAFAALENFREKNPGWAVGFFGYDLKNEVEDLTSNNPDHLRFPDLYFFVPSHVIVIKGDEAIITSDSAEAILAAIENQEKPLNEKRVSADVKTRFSKLDYIRTVDQIKDHISRGDIYVTNFCQEFYAEKAEIDPLAIFKELNTISPNPFSAFFKLKDQYILCASPERFLAKRESRLISQPIKGTARRGKDEAEDELMRNQLKQHAKEQQENVMIVDLVRNDLTRSARPGTVTTEELFGIYTFSQVHQMISTVVCEIDENVSPVAAIKNAFPMGSMTGAPKVSAMRLMEQYEKTRRGVYSGAIGYFGPDGEFDFNVVIRTLLYNSSNRYLSFQAGSAITWHADAEKEYEECLLKISGILQALGQPLS
jgi:para-aminobenzoate synthetase component 1